MRLLSIALALSLLSACSSYPPDAAYVTEPPAPATRDNSDAVDTVVVAQNTAAGVVFFASDGSKLSGSSPATGARSLDERIARVIPTTRDAPLHASDSAGPVFVVYGVSVGETQIEVFLDGESAGVLPIRVIAQE